jgi:hypothetical protein
MKGPYNERITKMTGEIMMEEEEYKAHQVTTGKNFTQVMLLYLYKSQLAYHCLWQI